MRPSRLAMPARATPYPLPDAVIRDLRPEELAACAVAGLRRVYGLELDYTQESLLHLQELVGARFRVGEYGRDDFPEVLAMALGAYLGEVLKRHGANAHWGTPRENLFATPLPFLIFTWDDHERQTNVVEDTMIYLWSGVGLPPRAYFDFQARELERLEFTAAR